jgi:hypothetical protein
MPQQAPRRNDRPWNPARGRRPSLARKRDEAQNKSIFLGVDHVLLLLVFHPGVTVVVAATRAGIRHNGG